MNEQTDKERMNCALQTRSGGDVVSPVTQLEAVTRKVWLDDGGKIKVESTCLGCGKTFVLRLDMPLFLTQMTAATCASHAYEFWHAISDKYMRPEWDVFDLYGRMWKALGEMKQSMQCYDDGTCVIRKKCPECQKVFSFRLPLQKIEEWESWLEQYDYDGRYCQHEAGDDDWQYHPYGFWRDMPRIDAQFIAGLCVFSNACRKCERREREELFAMLKNNARRSKDV